MKVVCGACQAKYQIPDERVAGRKLKIRCRKCGEAIVVRGDQLAPEEPTQQAHTNGHHVNGVGGGDWHISIDGDQHGPYATEQMASMLRAGQVTWEAYAWREGYADWKVAAESDTLVRAVANLPTATPEPVAAPEPNPFEDDGPTRIAGSAPPGALAPVARTAFSARAAQRATGNYEPVQEAAPVAVAPVAVAAQDYAYAAAPAQSAYGHSYSPYVCADQALTGERHEDSVLFSTKNLQAATAASQASPARAGFAGGEGSGLIDIRALAALARTTHTQSTNGAGATNGATPSASESGQFGRRGRDEVMTLANQTGAFSNLDSLRPFEAPARQTSNAVPIAIVVGSAMVAAAVVVAVLLTRDTPPVPASAVAVSQPIAPEPAAAPAADPEPAVAEPTAAEPAAAAARAEEPEAEAEKPEPAPRATERAERRSSTTSSKRAPARESKAEAKPAKGEAVSAKAAAAPKKESGSIDDLLLGDSKPEKAEKAEKEKAAPEPDDDLLAEPAPAKPAPSRSRSIDELLEGAVDESKKAEKADKPAASAASAALPDSPSRDQVKGALQGVEPAVKACADASTPDGTTATVALTVSGSSGKVSSVRVTGIQGPVGSCVARAVRNATFPKFAKESFSVNFPFRLK